MLEKTTCEKFCQKRPPTSGGTLARRHVARAAWASAGRPLPLGRVGPAAILVAGKVTWHHAAITVAGTQPSND
jgi:hypothetical protein